LLGLGEEGSDLLVAGVDDGAHLGADGGAVVAALHEGVDVGVALFEDGEDGGALVVGKGELLLEVGELLCGGGGASALAAAGALGAGGDRDADAEEDEEDVAEGGGGAHEAEVLRLEAGCFLGEETRVWGGWGTGTARRGALSMRFGQL